MVLGKHLVPGLIVGQGPTAPAVGVGGGCLDSFALIYLFSPLSPSLWETARYRLTYCLKGQLNPKQPTKPVPERPTSLDNRKARVYCACSRCRWGCSDIFLSFIFCLFFLPLWEAVRYRLKYCLKGPLNPK